MLDLDTIVSLCKRRGFIFQSSEIYGGFANSWDYGPLGVELKNNIKHAWWERFVRRRDDIVGFDAAILMNSKVWEASGHLDNFTDPLVDCKSCKRRFRADHLLKNESIKPDMGKMKEPPLDISMCPECGGKLTKARNFNMMFKTSIGPVEDAASVAYLRPETAQAMFVQFKNVIDSQRPGLPFGIGQIGKAFRNEITPGNFIFRTREFEQMEIEYFVDEKDWKKEFEKWLKEMKEWVSFLGIKDDEVIYKEIAKEDLAHYSKRTVDVEYKFPFGQEELYGLAYRTDYDLKRHAAKSGIDLSIVDSVTGKKVIPHVIEPSLGVDRSFLACLLSAYSEEDAPTAKKDETEKRAVLKFPASLAPYKVAVLPLSKKPELAKIAKRIADKLRKQFMVMYDETQSIGKRYRRQDEIGTPLCVTIDFESLDDKQVTVRDRDTMKQERIAIGKLKSYIAKKINV